MRNIVIVVVGALLASACASSPPMYRNKPGATQQEFESTRYACLQESQVRRSGAAVNAYGGAASNAAGCDYQMYDACMRSRGFTLSETGQFHNPVNCIQ